MEQNKNEKGLTQQAAGQPQKKQEMPEKKADTSSKQQTSSRPEIDLPVQGGRAESDLSSKTHPQRDIQQKNAPRDEKRETR